MESPSTPTKYSMLNARIHTKCCASCTPVSVGSYSRQAATAATKESPLVTSAMRRAPSSTSFFGRFAT